MECDRQSSVKSRDVVFNYLKKNNNQEPNISLNITAVDKSGNVENHAAAFRMLNVLNQMNTVQKLGRRSCNHFLSISTFNRSEVGVSQYRLASQILISPTDSDNRKSIETNHSFNCFVGTPIFFMTFQ